MSNQLFADIAEIKADVRWLKDQHKYDRVARMRWSIAMSVCFVASFVSVLIAVIS